MGGFYACFDVILRATAESREFKFLVVRVAQDNKGQRGSAGPDRIYHNEVRITGGVYKRGAELDERQLPYQFRHRRLQRDLNAGRLERTEGGGHLIEHGIVTAQEQQGKWGEVGRAGHGSTGGLWTWGEIGIRTHLSAHGG